MPGPSAAPGLLAEPLARVGTASAGPLLSDPSIALTDPDAAASLAYVSTRLGGTEAAVRPPCAVMAGACSATDGVDLCPAGGSVEPHAAVDSAAIAPTRTARLR